VRKILFLFLIGFFAPYEFCSVSSYYHISEDLKDFDKSLKEKFHISFWEYASKKHADVIDALMSSKYAKNLKRTSFHLSYLPKIINILSESSVEHGFFVNNIYAATPWIKRENHYYSILSLSSFVTTKNVYKLLKNEGVFEGLKRLTIK